MAGWIRIFALIGVAALLANAQCYDKCVSAAAGSDSSSDQAPSKSCHHQKSSQGDSAPCPPQHPEIAGPEAGIAKIGLQKISLQKIGPESTMISTLTLDSGLAAKDPQRFARVDTGSPPDVYSGSTISLLRI